MQLIIYLHKIIPNHMHRLIIQPKNFSRTRKINPAIHSRPKIFHSFIRKDFDKYAKLIKSNPGILQCIDARDHSELLMHQSSDFFTKSTLECIHNTIVYAQDFEKYFGHIKLYKLPHKASECYLVPKKGDYKNTGCHICEIYTWEYNSLDNYVSITELLQREDFYIENLLIDGANKRIIIHPNIDVDACCG